MASPIISRAVKAAGNAGGAATAARPGVLDGLRETR